MISDPNNQQQLKVTPASDWRPKTKLLQLPTGRVVEVKDVDLKILVMSSNSGDVPDLLTPEVMKLLETGQTDPQALEKIENVSTMMPFVEKVITQVMVYPRIVPADPDYDNGEILYSNMDLETEVFAIFEYLMNSPELASAQRFRPGQDENLDAVQPGSDVQPIAEQSAGV